MTFLAFFLLLAILSTLSKLALPESIQNLGVSTAVVLTWLANISSCVIACALFESISAEPMRSIAPDMTLGSLLYIIIYSFCF